MNDFVFPLFPSGLDSSVITTVWIGVIVVSFFTLRFGWVGSGLVVPGYVVPLLIVKPWVAAVILIESCITYFIVWTLSEYLSRWGKWSSLFGRDRFFALLLFSIIVKVLFDGWVLPAAGEFLNETFHLTFDYRNNLHSFGLIIVALMANQFWKPGFFRGVIPLAVTVGISYAIVRFVLMEFTNFTISNLGYLYEDIAASILASPKAYIILLTTAFIASRMNLRYGWEFNGILVPSLVTLLWYHPQKVLVTFIESFIVLQLAVLVLRTPLFRTATIEGIRKILLFFHVSFAYKFVLAYLMLWLTPETKITDFFGFGYLIPTLIAIKMHDTEAVARTMRVTVQTSLASLAVASIAGFTLTFLPGLPSRPPSPAAEAREMVKESGTGLIDRVRQEKVALYQGRRDQSYMAPTLPELDAFSRGVRLMVEGIESGDDRVLRDAVTTLAGAHYQVSLLDDRYYLLTEREPARGWGLYVVDGRAKGRLLVEVPAPLDEWGVIDAGAWLFKTLDARALAVAGTGRRVNKDGSSDVLANYNTIYHAFHREVSRRDVLQVRSYTAESARGLAGRRPAPTETGLPQPESTVWIRGSLPPGLHLPLLKDVIGTFRVEWGRSPFQNLQRDAMSAGFAELILNRADLKRVLFRHLLSAYGREVKVAEQRIDGYLQDWVLKGKGSIAEKGTKAFVKPRLEEMLFMDEEVLTPLLRVAKNEYRSGEISKAGIEELQTADGAASILGYRVIRYRHRSTGQDYFILAEDAAKADQKHWGTYVVRLGPSNGFVVQIPRPIAELNSFEYGVALFERASARALLIGGAHPLANPDGSADPVRIQNKENLFNLSGQAVLREYGDVPLLVIQTRALGLKEGSPPLRADALLSFAGGTITTGGLSLLGRTLVGMIERDGLSYRFVDGSSDTAGYEVGGLPQSLYLNQTAGKEFLVVWLSPTARRAYGQHTEYRLEEAQFRALGIQTVEDDLQRYLLNTPLADSASLPGQLRPDIARYTRAQDAVILRSLVSRYEHTGFRRFIDINSKQAFLLVFRGDGRLALVANLSPRGADRSMLTDAGKPESSVISDYLNSRAPFLAFRGKS